MKNIRTELNGNVLELKNVNIINGHDDSLPFSAEVHFNGKHIGSSWNDGWGASAVISTELITDDMKDIWNSFCEAIKNTKWTIMQIEGKDKILYYDMPFLVDCMAFYAITENMDYYDLTKLH